MKMGSKGGSKHLKRNPAPKFWPIHRKEATWTIKPKPGPHPILGSIPLAILVRDILGFAKTRKEARSIISQGKISIDGQIRREERFPTGLMDVISIPDAEREYRVLPSEKGLILHSIDKEEATFKLCRIENKSIVPEGHVQLNLHDGRNILLRVKDPRNPAEEDIYQTLDVLKIKVPNQEITGHIKLSEGLTALIIGGKNRGMFGKIVAIEKQQGQRRRKQLVTIEDKGGNRFQTILDYVFVLGEAKSPISLAGAD